MTRAPDSAFWRGKRVLLTGHTGFKGAWTCLMLEALGADVIGLSLSPAELGAFAQLGIAARLRASYMVDIRDAAAVAQVVQKAQPDVVIHMAAQALVGEGYRDPAGTFATNVNGTIHLLQALRGAAGVAAAVIVTSDKVYRHDALGRPFIESDALGGHDPYSSSKAATELVVASWCHSFKSELPPMATARAGNVIGGGDFAQERLIPDLVRARRAGRPLMLRNPDATRPFQHVHDVISGYLLLAEALAQQERQGFPAAFNFGPQDAECRVRDLLTEWQRATGQALQCLVASGPLMAEQPRLALDSGRAAGVLGWRPHYDLSRAIAETARWYAAWDDGDDMPAYSQAAMTAFLSAKSKEPGP